MDKSIIKRGLISTTCLLASLSVQEAAAEFELNFLPKDNGVLSTSITHGSDGKGGQTAFLITAPLQLPELVTDPETGDTYYHVIVGDLADGFIQETYIQASYDWGRWPAGPNSAVGGAGNASGGNGLDPLDRDPGISTANAAATPRRVLVRQIVTDGEITMEFLKDKYSNKPLITQSLVATDITADFSLDMRHISYDDDTTAGIMESTMAIADQGTEILSFDIATDAQDFEVTGGRYTYTDGSSYGGSDGTYSYVGGDFDHKGLNWEAYFDHGANNPWAYDTYKPQ